jgi:hypothetical protein
MPELPISEELAARMDAFKAVVEAVIEEKLDPNAYTEFLLSQAMDALLADLLRDASREDLLRSLGKLAARHPQEVYAFVVEILREGQAAIDAKAARRRFGFAPPSESSAVAEGDCLSDA